MSRRSGPQANGTPRRIAKPLFCTATRPEKQNSWSGNTSRAASGSVDFLQRDDVGIERARVAAQRGDVFVAARQLVRDIAGHGAARTVTRRIRRRAGWRQRPQRFRFHEPLEIPGGEFQLAGPARGRSRARREDDEDGDEPGACVAWRETEVACAPSVARAARGYEKKARPGGRASSRSDWTISASRSARRSARKRPWCRAG